VQEAIRLDGVTLKYRKLRERIRSLKEYTIRKLTRRTAYEDFVALHAIDLAVAPGETLGVVGRNGAGKSTLVRLIARVIDPTEGRVRVAGRIAPLLELGLGFHSELTGRENIVLQGALLGFSRRSMRRRIDAIAGWAELEEFIDTPIRAYSSGMIARLAFSVATDVNPDILLIDETLAVGDERFQRKCQERMEAFRRAGKTVLFVSHELDAVRETCRRAIWLDRGRIVKEGDSASVTAAYHAWAQSSAESPPESFPTPRTLPAT
jgi:ABC-type polysaccharide/polyol phosphate transport system ATPase subunit